MKSLVTSLLDWNTRQRLHFRTLRRLCLPATWPLLAIWAALMLLLIVIPLPFNLLAILAVPTAILPVIILLHWLIPVPQIWNIHGSWVAIGMVVISALLALFGRFYAGIVLNSLFGEAPNLFPISYGAGTYFGAVFGLAALVALSAAILFALQSLIALLVSVMGLGQKRRLFEDFQVLFAFGIAIIAPVGSMLFIDLLASSAMRIIALEGDFFPDYRCETGGWPEGISRVAFIGDEQALGYREADDRFFVLRCFRKNIQGDEPGA